MALRGTSVRVIHPAPPGGGTGGRRGPWPLLRPWPVWSWNRGSVGPSSGGLQIFRCLRSVSRLMAGCRWCGARGCAGGDCSLSPAGAAAGPGSQAPWYSRHSRYSTSHPSSHGSHPQKIPDSSPHRRPQPVYGHDTPSGVATAPNPQGGHGAGTPRTAREPHPTLSAEPGRRHVGWACGGDVGLGGRGAVAAGRHPCRLCRISRSHAQVACPGRMPGSHPLRRIGLRRSTGSHPSRRLGRVSSVVGCVRPGRCGIATQSAGCVAEWHRGHGWTPPGVRPAPMSVASCVG